MKCYLFFDQFRLTVVLVKVALYATKVACLFIKTMLKLCSSFKIMLIFLQLYFSQNIFKRGRN